MLLLKLSWMSRKKLNAVHDDKQINKCEDNAHQDTILKTLWISYNGILWHAHRPYVVVALCWSARREYTLRHFCRLDAVVVLVNLLVIVYGV